MSSEIIGLGPWLASPPGRYLLAWEQARLDDAVADLFGYHSVQLGFPPLQGLRSNRMPHRWQVLSPTDAQAFALPPGDAATPWGLEPDLWAEPTALPFGPASLDLVVLPHTLELSLDPHTTLREVERVLVPEGRVVICGLNPASLWGLRQARARLARRLGGGALYLPEAGDFIGYWRLRDWLRLLGFEVESAQFGCYRPAVRSSRWLERFSFMERWGERWWPILGAAYFLVAVKRVHGMRLLGPAWRAARAPVGAQVPVARHGLPARPTMLEEQDSF